MKALILNSGMGSRMGVLTSEHPKCMTEIEPGETILGRQLKLLLASGVTQVVMTTGLFDKVLTDYCDSLGLDLSYTFVKNPVYDRTNYIYSIYMAKNHLKEDVLLLHGDLVFEQGVLQEVLESKVSCMTVSSTLPLPPKDFKAVIIDGRINKVGIEFFDQALAAQPLYKLNQADWKVWLNKIIEYCETGKVSCYAENAFNEVSDKCLIYPLDCRDKLCNEIDTPEDLTVIAERIKILKNMK